MNIAIDVLAILGPDSKNRGIGNYATSQLKQLFRMDKSNRYFLLNFYEDISLKELLDYSDNVSEHYFYLGPDNFLSRNTEFKPIFGELVKRFISENRIDIYYLTSPFDDHISYDVEWFGKVKLITTLYDIIPYIFKDKYLNSKEALDKYLGWAKNVTASDKVLAISQSAKNDLVGHFQVDPSRIDVIYAGVEDCFRVMNLTDDEKEEVKERYKIKNPFIMCPAGDDERKNIAGVIEAYSKLPAPLISQYQLVVVCKLSQGSMERYKKLADKFNLVGRVVFTNFVPLEDLVKLYNMAHVVAFPSKYEGFGLPVVEAMACGAPVLTSNNSSLGEIANGAAILVDPFNTDDIARGLAEILEMPNHGDMIKRGFERVKQFGWNDVASKTLAAFQEAAIRERKASETEQKAENRKIAFFTPLPPIESGIADYSADILNKLSNDFEIDVFIDDHYTPNIDFGDNVKIYPHHKFPGMKNRYREYVFQMGNSEYHVYMINYIQECAGKRGVLVLHDANLHGMLHFMSRSKGMKLYRKFLNHDYDDEVVDEYLSNLKAGKTGPKIFEMPVNGFVTKYVRKIVVHSDYAKKQLLNRDIGLNVMKIPHYVEIKELNDKHSIRNKLNIPLNCIVLAAFGHIHSTKRIMPIVKAFHALSKKDERLRLYLVGKPSAYIEEELNDFIRTNQLTEKITITGFVGMETFEDFIDASDICFNLRYPYNGESSGSLMRILAKGKCVIVNDIGSFSEIPDDCCVKLKSPELLSENEEIINIVSSVEDLLNSDHMKQMGAHARNYARNVLNFDRVIDLYKKAINSPNQSNCLSEGIIAEMGTRYFKGRVFSQKEVYEISKTLAYIICEGWY